MHDSDENCGGQPDFQNIMPPSTQFNFTMKKLQEAHRQTLDICGKLRSQEQQENDDSDDVSEPESNYKGTENRAQNGKLKKFLFNHNGSTDVQLLNKSIGSTKIAIAKDLRDRMKDFSLVGASQRSPEVSMGVALASGGHDYDFSSSDNDDGERERYKENRSAVIHNDTHRSAMARIEDMWDVFRVDDYAPWLSFRENLKLQRSRSLTRVAATPSKERNSGAVLWRRKITVPEPPTMLLREANKTPKKTRAMLELDEQREERRLAEEMECRKQFRASPAPEHVHLRLLDELLYRKQDDRKRELREHGAEVLRSLQKPFEFSEREEKKTTERAKRETRELAGGKKSGRPFKARPFPAHIFDEAIDDRILEEEEYRRIRMQARAEELLNSSVAPYSMRMKQKSFRERLDDVDRGHEFVPKVNETVPDLDGQYEKFMETLVARKGRKEPTVFKPFNMRQTRSATTKHKIHENLSEDEAVHRQIGSLSQSLNSTPTVAPTSRKQSKRQKLNANNLSKKTLLKNFMRRRKGLAADASDGSCSSPELSVYDRRQNRRTPTRDDMKSNRSFTVRPNRLQRRRKSYLDAADDSLNANPSDVNNSNSTFYSEGSDSSKMTSESSTLDSNGEFWSQPVLDKRSEFWSSNPVAVLH